MENRTVDPRALYTDSQWDGLDMSRSYNHTQEPSTTSGPIARIKYPFVSGGSEDMGDAGSRTTSHTAPSTSNHPIDSVVELGEIRAESGRPNPQRFDAHSLGSLRPPQDEDIEANEAETREALLALGPDISTHIRWYDDVPQKS
ncbi:hypothetical protein FPCIR_11536 [Fusarium pseudocircinatum]|uniref:Uncharacterized protein n=1 Tax=Fusarium pseudocircinatum TaxID=56676 RepID=A0A8H5KV18_9HYPO|nr:hypothetical protein FPCIR_11536 [Fusarium pseudocircinatum]